MDVHLRDLRYFLAVAEELHMTRAAERLFISQPALSKQIRALERQMGCTLFDRNALGMALTTAGETLVTPARQLLDSWDEAEAAVRSVAEQRVLVVGIQTAVGRDLQREALERFRTTHPTWTVSLRLIGWDDPAAGLLDGRSDVALCWLPVPEDELAVRVLAEEPRWVALPARHRLATLDHVPFAELLDEPFLALPGSAGRLRDFWLAIDERHGRTPTISGIVTTAEETFEAVTAGMGVVLLAKGNTDLYARPGIVCRPVTGLAPAQLAVVWRRADQRDAARTLVASFSATASAKNAHSTT